MAIPRTPDVQSPLPRRSKRARPGRSHRIPATGRSGKGFVWMAGRSHFFPTSKKKVENPRWNSFTSLTGAQVGSFIWFAQSYFGWIWTRHVEDARQKVALMMLQSGEAFRMKLFFPIIYRSFIHPNPSCLARLMRHQQEKPPIYKARSRARDQLQPGPRLLLETTAEMSCENPRQQGPKTNAILGRWRKNNDTSGEWKWRVGQNPSITRGFAVAPFYF